MADFRYTYDLAMDKVSKKQSLKDLEQFSEAVKKISPEISPFSQKDLTRLDRDLKKAKSVISDTFTGQRYVQFDDLNKSLSKAGINLKEVNDKVLKIGKAESQVGGIVKKYRDLAQEVSTVNALHNKLNKFVTTFSKLVNFKVSIAAYQFITQQFREALEFTKELDKTLTEIATVSGVSRKQLGQFAVDFNMMAEAMGRTTNEMAQASVIFFRQGKETAEVMQLVEATTIAASIAHTEMAQTSEYLTATLNGFKLAAEDALSVVDKFSAIAANAGTSFEELAIGLTKVASGARSAGVDIDNMMSYIATVSEATRETATNVGTSFKTIIARFRGITADGHESAATLNSVDEALQSINIHLRDQETGQLRDLQDVLAELGTKWKDLDINTKAYLATVAAGTRQQNRFIALMDNYDRSLEILEISLNSAGAAQAQFGEFSKGIEFSVNQLKAAVEKLWSSLVSSDDIKLLVQSLTKVVKVFTYLTENFSHLTFFAIAFSKQLNIIATAGFTAFAGITKLNQGMNRSMGTVKKLTTSYKLFSQQRKKIQTDKFAEQVLTPSEFEQYKTGVDRAAEAYRQAQVPLQQASTDMQLLTSTTQEARAAIEEFGSTWNSARLKTDKDLFAEETTGKFKGQKPIDPETFRITNQELLESRVASSGLTQQETVELQRHLELTQGRVELNQENLEKLKQVKRVLPRLRAEQNASKEILKQQVALQKQKTAELNKQRKSVALLRLASISTLLVVQSVAEAFREADWSIEGTRDRVLKLTNSLASMALIMSPEPITKAIAAGVLIASALVDRFWKTSTERLQEYRNEIEKLNEDLTVLTSIDESYEELRRKAEKGGISFLDPDEQKQLFDYMQRIANIDKDLVIDYSIDGRPIVDLTKSINELIDAQRRLVKESKDAIAETSKFAEKWNKLIEKSVSTIYFPEDGARGALLGLPLPDFRSEEEKLQEALKRQREMIMNSFTFLINETAQFKKIFVNQFMEVFGEKILEDSGIIIEIQDVYESIQDALVDGAKDGLLTQEQADKIVSDLLEKYKESFDLEEDELDFIVTFTDKLKETFIDLSEETLVAEASLTTLLQTYADVEEAFKDLTAARQKLEDKEELSAEEVLNLVDAHESLIKHLDLTAKNYGLTKEALEAATGSIIQQRIIENEATIQALNIQIQEARVRAKVRDGLYEFAIALKVVSQARLESLQLAAWTANAEIRQLRAQKLNAQKLGKLLENYTLNITKAKDEGDEFVATMERSSLEFKNLNELLETSNEQISVLKKEIKELEEVMRDADLTTTGTLEEHIIAYETLRGVLQGQLNLQNNLKEEALEGLKQVIDILQKDIPGININDIIIDGKVDDKKFNNLVNFAKEKVNELNEEIAKGRGTKTTVEQIQIYGTLIDEVEKYKDAIEKSEIAVSKVNEELEKTRKQQQEYYTSILDRTLNYIEDALKQKFEKALEDIKKLNEENVTEIEKQRDIWEEILEKQKDRLETEKELRDIEKERRDLLKSIGEKQSEINKLSLDDSLFAKKRIDELKKLIDKDKTKLEDVEYDATFDARISALDQLDAVKQGDFEKRLGDLEAYLQSQEIKFETLLREGNLERMAAALLRGAKFKIIGDEIISLNSLVEDLGNTLLKIGTREQLKGFEEFQEDLGIVTDLFKEVGIAFTDIVIDWSQIKPTNLEEFQQEITNAAKAVGDTFSLTIFKEFEEGTLGLVNQVSETSQEMEDTISDHANSIVKIYEDMIKKAVKEAGKLSGVLDPAIDEAVKLNELVDAIYGDDIDREKAELGRGIASILREMGFVADKLKEVINASKVTTPEVPGYVPPASVIIETDAIDEEALEKWMRDRDNTPQFNNGGIVNYDGLAMVHGEQSPEWIFNSAQLESVIQMTNASMMKQLSNFALSDAQKANGGDLIIQNLVNVEGNADQQTIKDLEKFAKKIVPYVNKQLVKNIKKI